MPWGLWSLSQIQLDGEMIGWGANCYKHSDNGSTLVCKKSITYGKGRDAFTDDACIAKMKLWLTRGHALVSELADGRNRHVHGIDARALPVLPDAELDGMCRACGFEP